MSPAGSHKPNTAVAQAYYNKKEGIKRLATETGAGQWGSALCFAGKLFGLKVTVYMVKISYEQKPYRRLMMETWGGEVFASPTTKTNSGQGHPGRAPGQPRLAWASPSARRWKTRPPMTTPITRSARS